MEKEFAPLTPREAAKRLIRTYVLRGETQEQLRNSHMGSWNSEYRASIGGACFRVTEDGKFETVRQFKTSQIGVTRIADEVVCEIFPLKDIYEEIQRDNDPTAHRQITLFDFTGSGSSTGD